MQWFLRNLVALNCDPTAEEAGGLIRWLRPEYQNPDGKQAEAKGKTAEMDLGVIDKAAKTLWPKALPDQMAAVRGALDDLGDASVHQVARTFHRARVASVAPLLESLAALGAARHGDKGRFSSTR